MLVFFSVVTFFINTTSFSSFSAIVGTLAGFLSGSYITAGCLPKTVQNILNYWTGFEIAGLLRNRLMPLHNTPNRILISLGVIKDNRKLVEIFILIVIFLIVEKYLSKLRKEL